MNAMKEWLPLIVAMLGTLGAGRWWGDYVNRQKSKKETIGLDIENQEKLKKLKQEELADLLKQVDTLGAKLLQHEAKIASTHLMLAEKQKENIRLLNQNQDMKREAVIMEIRISKLQQQLKHKS